MSHFQFAQSEEALFAGGNKSQFHLFRSYFLLSCQKYVHCKSLYFRNTEGEAHTSNFQQPFSFHLPNS